MSKVVLVEKCSRQISGFISFLENNPRQRRRVADDDNEYNIESPTDL
jgi:hypothetical protein